jgi:hypothetical protein
MRGDVFFLVICEYLEVIMANPIISNNWINSSRVYSLQWMPQIVCFDWSSCVTESLMEFLIERPEIILILFIRLTWFGVVIYKIPSFFKIRLISWRTGKGLKFKCSITSDKITASKWLGSLSACQDMGFRSARHLLNTRKIMEDIWLLVFLTFVVWIIVWYAWRTPV